MNIPILIIGGAIICSWLYRDPGVCYSNDQSKPGECFQIKYTYESEAIAFYKLDNLLSINPNVTNATFFQKDPHQVTIKIHCDILMTFFFEKNNEKDIVFKIDKLNVKSDNHFTDFSLLKKEVEKPIFVHLSKNGQFNYIRSDSSLSPASTQFAYSIIGSFQFIRDKQKPIAWQISEQNTVGDFIANYQFQKKDRYGKKFLKKITGTTTGGALNAIQKTEEDLIAEYVFDEKNNIRSIVCSESLITKINSDTISLSGSRHSVTFQSEKRLSESDISFFFKIMSSEKYKEKNTLNFSMNEDQFEKQQSIKKLGSNNLDSLLTKLRLPPSEENETELILQFKALMFLYPETCKLVGERLKAEAYNSYQYRILLHSLLWTDSDASYEALTDFMRKNKYNEKLLFDILPSLAISKTPSVKLMNFLKEMSVDVTQTKNIRPAFQLVFAATANNFLRKHTEFYKEVSVFLFDSLVAYADTMHKIRLLGNSGLREGFIFLKKYISDTTISKVYRGEAVYSLRFIDDRNVDFFIDSLSSIPTDSLMTKSLERVRKFRTSQYR